MFSIMHIAIDYNAAVRQGGGIGRFVREITQVAAAAAPQHRFSLWYAARGLEPDSVPMQALRELCARNRNIKPRPIPITERLLTIIWQRAQLPLPVEWLVGRADVVHGTDFVLPPTSARTLLSIHDFAYKIHPETAQPELRRYLTRAVPRNIRRADHVHVNSIATQRDMERLLHVSHAKSTIVYSGSGTDFYPRNATEISAMKTRLHLPERYLLNVGTVQPRKNVERLIAAYAALGDVARDVPLVIAGKRGWLAEPIYAAVQQHNLAERVQFLDFVADDDLPTLYSGALAMVYPSLYEGFGVPIVEAQACGTPVITSIVSSLPEIAGEAALLVDPHSTIAITAAMRRVLTEPQLAASLRDTGPQQAAKFTWEGTGLGILALYERLAQP